MTDFSLISYYDADARARFFQFEALTFRAKLFVLKFLPDTVATRQAMTNVVAFTIDDCIKMLNQLKALNYTCQFFPAKPA